jgi:hypothetical protein
VEGEYGLQEARVGGDGVEYIRTSKHDAEVERLTADRDDYRSVRDLARDEVYRLRAEVTELRSVVERLREALNGLLDDYLNHMQENSYTEWARAALAGEGDK